MKKNNKKGIVFCGRFYYIDLEINYGILDIILFFDMVVLIEDSVLYLGILKDKLRVVD